LNQIPTNQEYDNLKQLLVSNSVKELMKILNLNYKNRLIVLYLHSLKFRVASNSATYNDTTLTNIDFLKYQINMGLISLMGNILNSKQYEKNKINDLDNKPPILEAFNSVVNALRRWVDNKNKTQTQINAQHGVSPLNKTVSKVQGFGADYQ
jgi:hypothetical protein